MVKEFLANKGHAYWYDQFRSAAGVMLVASLKNIVLGSAVVWMFYSISTLFKKHEEPFPSRNVSDKANWIKKPMSIRSDKLRDLDYSQAKDMFGIHRGADSVATTTIDISQKNASKLDVVVTGIARSNRSRASWVIVTTPHGGESLYQENNEIMGMPGVEVTLIHDRHIQLNNNGQFETVALYIEDGTTAHPTEKSFDRLGEIGPAVSIPASELADVTSIWDVVKFKLVSDSGGRVGVEVRPGRKRNLFNKIGLKSGDLITQVNGLAIRSPSDLNALNRLLKESSSIDLLFVRDGEIETLQVQLR